MKYFLKIIKYFQIANKLILVIFVPQILLASSDLKKSQKVHFTKKTELSEICEISPVDDELVRGRASFVTFPDKRQITVVGHIHGARRIDQIVYLVLSGEYKTITDKQFNNFLLNIFNESSAVNPLFKSKEENIAVIDSFNREYQVDISSLINIEPPFSTEVINSSVLKNSEQDYDYLSKLFRSSLKSKYIPKFIGIEASPKTWTLNQKNQLVSLQKFTQEYKKRKQSGQIQMSNEDFEKILKSSTTGSIYFYFKNIHQLPNLYVLPTESNRIEKSYLKEPGLDEIEQDLESLTNADENYLKNLSTQELDTISKDSRVSLFYAKLLLVKSDIESMNINSNSELENKINIVQSFIPPWLEQKTKLLFNDFRSRVNLFFERNNASAIKLSQRNQTGIHFVGLNHLHDTLKKLKEICIKENSKVKR